MVLLQVLPVERAESQHANNDQKYAADDAAYPSSLPQKVHIKSHVLILVLQSILTFPTSLAKNRG
jgi:hypothetical protein